MGFIKLLCIINNRLGFIDRSLLPIIRWMRFLLDQRLEIRYRRIIRLLFIIIITIILLNLCWCHKIFYGNFWRSICWKYLFLSVYSIIFINVLLVDLIQFDILRFIFLQVINFTSINMVICCYIWGWCIYCVFSELLKVFKGNKHNCYIVQGSLLKRLLN